MFAIALYCAKVPHTNKCSIFKIALGNFPKHQRPNRKPEHPHVVPCVLGRFHVLHFHY